MNFIAAVQALVDERVDFVQVIPELEGLLEAGEPD